MSAPPPKATAIADIGRGPAMKMRDDRELRDEIFEEWLSQLSEDERSAVERGSPAKKLRRKFLAFCKTLSEGEQRTIFRSVLDEIFS
jgi:hypothetical protein